jgi:hypothetical protein
MPANHALQRIQRELADNPPVNVVLASRPYGQDQDNLQRLNIGAELQQQFQRIAREGLTGEMRLLEYEPGYKPDSGEVLWIDLADVEPVRGVVERISNFQDLVIFQENRDEFLDYLRYYALFARIAARRSVTLFRATSAKLELGRGSKIGAILRGGQYDTVEETVFLFDRSVDCWSDGTYMFINNVGNFERIFRYFEELERLAEQTVAAVLDRIPIANADAFRQACTTQRRFMTKLAAIAKRPYFGRITINDLRRTIREHELDIEVVRENGRDHLAFDPDPSRRWTLLKLLDDDYLNSNMTHNKYEANSKLLRG